MHCTILFDKQGFGVPALWTPDATFVFCGCVDPSTLNHINQPCFTSPQHVLKQEAKEVSARTVKML